MTPSARCLAVCRRRNWIADVVERRIRSFITKDFLGVIDIVAIADGQILGIQATSGSNSAARVAKILAEPRAKAWLEAGARLAVWSWARQGKRGRRKVWTLREREVTAGEFRCVSKEAV